MNDYEDFKEGRTDAYENLQDLRQEYDDLKNDWNYIKSLLDNEFEKNIELKRENEQLNFENNRLKIILTELEMKCNKKQEHIVLLENKIHRMREQIKKLEGLYHYRGYIGSGDVKKEYYRMEKLLRAENNQLKKENEQLGQRCKELHNDFDYSALIKMLEDARALNIEDMIWNTMGYRTQTEFDDDFADYREDAKKRWRE